MPKNDQQNEPWKASFKDDQASQRSRSENRRQSRRVSFTVSALVIVVILLSFVPVYSYLQTLNEPAGTELKWSAAAQTKVTDHSKTSASLGSKTLAEQEKEAEKQAEAAKAKAEADAKAKAAADAEAAAKAKAAQASSQMAQSSSVVKEPVKEPEKKPETETSNPNDAVPANERRYVTVRPGLTSYGVARDAGMTFAQLQKLNPGVNLSGMKSGEQIRIK